MLRFLGLSLIIVWSACSATSHGVEAPLPAPSSTLVTAMIPADAVAVSRCAPQWCVVARSVYERLSDMTECWTKLQHQIEVGYEIWRGAAQPVLAIYQGNFDRAATEECATETFRIDGYEVRRDGALTVFATEAGQAVYVGWRDHAVVIGDRAAVTSALAATAPTSKLSAQLATASSGPMVVVGTHPFVADLLGVPAVHWEITIEGSLMWHDRPEALAEIGKQLDERARRRMAGLPPAPPPEPQHPAPANLRGRARIEYASPSDAAAAADHLARASFGVTRPFGLKFLSKLSKVSPTVQGATLVLELDQETLGALDLDELGPAHHAVDGKAS